MSQLTGIKPIDMAVIAHVKHDFEDWVERIVIAGANSDPSDGPYMGSDLRGEEEYDLEMSLYGEAF
jgi:hypothetical protein